MAKMKRQEIITDRAEKMCYHRPCQCRKITSVDWDEVTFISCEFNRVKQWIREAIRIQRESHGVMSDDERAFQLSHIYDDLLYFTTTSRGDLTVK